MLGLDRSKLYSRNRHITCRNKVGTTRKIFQEHFQYYCGPARWIDSINWISKEGVQKRALPLGDSEQKGSHGHGDIHQKRSLINLIVAWSMLYKKLVNIATKKLPARRRQGMPGTIELLNVHGRRTGGRSTAASRPWGWSSGHRGPHTWRRRTAGGGDPAQEGEGFLALPALAKWQANGLGC